MWRIWRETAAEFRRLNLNSQAGVNVITDNHSLIINSSWGVTDLTGIQTRRLVFLSLVLLNQSVKHEALCCR